MFIDASALCAILALENEAEDLVNRIRVAKQRLTSPLAVWETAVNLQRLNGLDAETSEREVGQLLGVAAIEVIAVEPAMTTLALDAFRRYGKGRHPAALNFGDCFAYACAKHHKVPLLYKGNDFIKTDIESA
jgi:ribonuclease VapC